MQVFKESRQKQVVKLVEKFWYIISRNVSGSQGHSWTETIEAENLVKADEMMKGKYPNHLIYLEGYQKR